MKPAAEDLEHRRSVWVALSELFLDTDTTVSRVERVRVLAASPYSVEELEEILLDEVYPVCRTNLYSPAGEWAGFDEAWLERRILRRLRSPFHRLRKFSLGRLTIRRCAEWRETREGVEGARLRLLSGG